MLDENGAERVGVGEDIASVDFAEKVDTSDGPIVPSLEASDAMHEGDEVVSISQTGKRKGQQGTLVGKQIEGTKTWMVRWSDGVENPYAIHELKKKTDKPKDVDPAETASPASLVETSGVAESVDVHEHQPDDEGAVSDGFADDEDDGQEEDVPRGPLKPISGFSAALLARNDGDDDRDDLSDGFEDTEKADNEDVHQPEASRENRILHLNTVTAMLVDDEGDMSDGFSHKTDSGNEEELLVATLVTC